MEQTSAASEYPSDWQTQNKVQQLLEKANAPTRHMMTKADPSGEWGKRRERLTAAFGGKSGAMIALLGPRGTGKTQLAVEVIKMTVNALRSAKYTRAIELFMDIKQSYNKERGDERSAVNKFVLPALLVIDEVQVRGESDWENNMLTYILDVRYAENKGTILIANLMPDAFAKSVGDSIMSRMMETGEIIECKWESFRVR